jgi:hypothetical protein
VNVSKSSIRVEHERKLSKEVKQVRIKWVSHELEEAKQGGKTNVMKSEHRLKIRRKATVQSKGFVC